MEEKAERFKRIRLKDINLVLNELKQGRALSSNQSKQLIECFGMAVVVFVISDVEKDDLLIRFVQFR